MAAGKRRPQEKYKAYRKRLKAEQEAEDLRVKGRLLWNSQAQGTYVRAKHGELR